jgi:hypothetical protein
MLCRMRRLLRISIPAALLLLAGCFCLLSTFDTVIKGHPTRLRLLPLASAFVLALALLGFCRGAGFLARARGQGSLRWVEGGLWMLALPLFVAYHLLASNWLMSTAYKFLFVLHIAHGSALSPN